MKCFCVEGVCEFSAVMAELDNLYVIIVGLYRPPPADNLRISMSVITPCKLASTYWIWKIGLPIVTGDFNWIYPLRVPSNVSRPWLHLSLNQQTPTFSSYCEIHNIQWILDSINNRKTPYGLEGFVPKTLLLALVHITEPVSLCCFQESCRWVVWGG